MRRRKGALEDVQVHRLVFDQGRGVREAKVDEDLNGRTEAGYQGAASSTGTRMGGRTSWVRGLLGEGAVKDAGWRSIMLDVVRSP